MAFNWFKKNKDKTTPDEAPAEDAAGEIDGNLHDEPIEDAPPPDDAEIQEETEVLEDTVTREEHQTEPETKGYFKHLKSRLSKTRNSFTGGFDKIFSTQSRVDDDVLEELEELLITSDIGVETSMELIERLSKVRVADADELKTALKKEIHAILHSEDEPDHDIAAKPHIIMVVGVNGVGKTTTIGKLAAKSSVAGRTVMVAAADTFRAAAVEQLTIWAERAGADIVKHKENADPAAVAYDAVEAAIAREIDTVFVDTAGRLHTKVNLMEELKKIKRTITKKMTGAPHEILLVLDATTGQNAVSQAKLFNEALDITGLALTKLDGTAKGGIVVSICHTLNIPLKYIGIGETIDDLRPFDADEFVEALF
jgi:fused signal recognition particle receptor